MGIDGQNGDVTNGLESEFSYQARDWRDPHRWLLQQKQDSKPLDNLDNQKLKMYPGTYRSLNMMAPAICCPNVFDYI